MVEKKPYTKTIKGNLILNKVEPGRITVKITDAMGIINVSQLDISGFEGVVDVENQTVKGTIEIKLEVVSK